MLTCTRSCLLTSLLILALLDVPSALQAETHVLEPGQSIQTAIDQAASGDVIVLRDGVYHEALNIDKSITLRAQNPGEATITNKYDGEVNWVQSEQDEGVWYAQGIDWPVHGMRVAGVHAFDYRNKENFDNQEVGPYWSKGWQADKKSYNHPPIYFAHDAEAETLWLHLDGGRDPNTIAVDFNSDDLDGETLVQKDLGTYWNQQQIVVISQDPPENPFTHWYSGSPDNPSNGRQIHFPPICGIVIDVNADDVTIEGLRIHLSPTVGVEVNNSHNVTIRDCYFSGYQFGINSGYEATNLTVEHCEFDGGEMVSTGRVNNVTNHMWNHSTYVNPVKYNGTGLTFKHNYVYEGYDLFHPRGRHKDFAHVPDLPSEVAYNVWQTATDNAIEFDSIEARITLRFHHNLVLQHHDALAITTTEDGGPLTIDHNLWWPGGNRIMKLNGTGRTNRGVQFLHNTYFTGNNHSSNDFEDSVFENNIVLSKVGGWRRNQLEAFFPTPYNLLTHGAVDFEGLTGDPQLGDTPETIFLPQADSPVIDAGIAREGYHQNNVTDGKPDLGALEYGQTIDDWRQQFGHCGPRWITAENADEKAPYRPDWPDELDKRWGGLDN